MSSRTLCQEFSNFKVIRPAYNQQSGRFMTCSAWYQLNFRRFPDKRIDRLDRPASLFQVHIILADHQCIGIIGTGTANQGSSRKQQDFQACKWKDQPCSKQGEHYTDGKNHHCQKKHTVQQCASVRAVVCMQINPDQLAIELDGDIGRRPARAERDFRMRAAGS